MSPEYKALELIRKFTSFVDNSNHDAYDPGYDEENEKENAKQCALICVDEILASNPMGDDDSWDVREIGHEARKFWTDVKEILTKP